MIRSGQMGDAGEGRHETARAPSQALPALRAAFAAVWMSVAGRDRLKLLQKPAVLDDNRARAQGGVWGVRI